MMTDRVSVKWGIHYLSCWIRALMDRRKVAQRVFLVWSPISRIAFIIRNKANWLINNLNNLNGKMVGTKEWLLLKGKFSIALFHSTDWNAISWAFELLKILTSSQKQCSYKTNNFIIFFSSLCTVILWYKDYFSLLLVQQKWKVYLHVYDNFGL